MTTRLTLWDAYNLCMAAICALAVVGLLAFAHSL